MTIFTTTANHHYFLVHSKSSRSKTHDLVLIVELSPKQKIKEVSLCAWVGDAAAMLWRIFGDRFFLIFSSIFQFNPEHHQLCSSIDTTQRILLDGCIGLAWRAHQCKIRYKAIYCKCYCCLITTASNHYYFMLSFKSHLGNKQ